MSLVLLVDAGLNAIIISYASYQFVIAQEGFAIAHVGVKLDVGELSVQNLIAINERKLSVFINLQVDGAVFVIAVGREDGDVECSILSFVLEACNGLRFDDNTILLLDSVLHGNAIGEKLAIDAWNGNHIHKHFMVFLFACLAIGESCNRWPHGPLHRLSCAVVNTHTGVRLCKCRSLACCLSPR